MNKDYIKLVMPQIILIAIIETAIIIFVKILNVCYGIGLVINNIPFFLTIITLFIIQFAYDLWISPYFKKIEIFSMNFDIILMLGLTASQILVDITYSWFTINVKFIVLLFIEISLFLPFLKYEIQRTNRFRFILLKIKQKTNFERKLLFLEISALFFNGLMLVLL